MHIDDLFSTLSDTLAGGKVDSDEKEAAIDAILDDFRTASKDADKARVTEKKPFDDGAKAVQVKWKPIVDKADRGALACKEALTPYRVAKQAAANEAARIAREESAAKAQAAQDALRKSDDLEECYQAEIQLEASKKLEAQANRIDRTATGLRTSWTAEITDKAAALRYYLNRHPDDFLALIQRLADQDARTARPDAPGITYHEIKKAA